MKTSNYLAELPQEATIKSIQALKDYNFITLDVSTASQRLCHQGLRSLTGAHAFMTTSSTSRMPLTWLLLFWKLMIPSSSSIISLLPDPTLSSTRS